MATMTDIAKLAGVSRGTVDRVINNRGGVGPELTERILRAASQLHYTPNKAARTLSTQKRNFLLTFILFDPNKALFYRDVLQGASQAAAELEDSGVTVRYRFLENWSDQQIVSHLDGALADGSSGIVLFGTGDPAVVGKVRQITAMGIPVMTVGSELPECGQLGFVGSDALSAGKTAAGLIRMIHREEIHLGAILGYRSSFYHKGRMAGLTAGLNQQNKPWKLCFQECNNDDDFDCYDIVREQIRLHPEVNTLFLSTSNVYGACRALEKLALSHPPKVVCYDNTAAIREMVNRGHICASIGQEPLRQGAEPLKCLFDFLAFGIRPQSSKIFVRNEIYIAENI